MAVEQLLRPADAVPRDGEEMQRRLPRRFDLLCSHLHSNAQGVSAARKVGPKAPFPPEVDLVVQGAPLVAALARRSVPPWRWRTSLPVGVAVAWNLPAVGPRTRSGGRRRAAASAGTPRPPRPACREVELGITSLASASAHPRTPALRITPTTQSPAPVSHLQSTHSRGRRGRRSRRRSFNLTGSTPSYSPLPPSMSCLS